MPNANFRALADEFKNLECEYERQIEAETAASHRRTATDRKIRMCCASSRQYLILPANELQTVLDHFLRTR